MPHGALDLETAIRLSVQASPSLNAAAWHARSAALRARGVAGFPNPTLDVTEENFGWDLGDSRRETTVSASQLFQLGGRGEKHVARAEQQVAEAEWTSQQRAIATETANVFLDAWWLERRLAILDQAERVSQATVSGARERTRIGAAPPVEARRAEGVLAERMIERRAVETELQSARRTLALQWGATRAEFDSLVLPPPAVPNLPPPDSLMNLLRSHPERLQAAAETALEVARFRQARGMRIPDLTLTFGARRLQEVPGNGFVAGASFPLPLWNQNGSFVHAAEAERSAALTRERAVERRLEETLYAAYDSLIAARDKEDRPHAPPPRHAGRAGGAAARLPRRPVHLPGSARRAAGRPRRGGDRGPAPPRPLERALHAREPARTQPRSGGGADTMRRLLLIAALALFLLPGCGRKEEKAEEKDSTQAKAAASGRVKLEPGAAQRAGILLGVAGPATIDVTVQLPGQIKPDSGRVLVVRPRFAGVVHALREAVGAAVRKGETIALVQSNESLTDYAIASSMTGRVVARGASVGEVVSTDTPLYTIIDLSDVWVEFTVYPHQLGAIRQGDEVTIAPQSEGGGPVASGRIAYLGPLLSGETGVSLARVTLPNPGTRWQPGLFVTVNVVTDRARAAVAVPDDAIVRTEAGPAVFITDGTRFQERHVVTGRSDGRMTEIVSGLAAGARIAAKNAFVLKAELEKSRFEED